MVLTSSCPRVTRELQPCQSSALIKRPTHALVVATRPHYTWPGAGLARGGRHPHREADRGRALRARCAVGGPARQHPPLPEPPPRLPVRVLRGGAGDGSAARGGAPRARRGARRPEPLPRLGRRARGSAPPRGGARPLPLRALRRRARVPDLRPLAFAARHG